MVHTREWRENAISIIVAASIAVLIILPLGVLIGVSFVEGDPWNMQGFTLSHFIENLTDPLVLSAICNTVTISLGSTAFAVTFGLVLAFIVVKTDTPLRKQASLLALVPYFFPSFFGAIAWIWLANPSSGALNVLWQEVFKSPGPFNIYGHAGMIWVMGIHSAPLAFVLLRGSLTSIDAALEESALICGGKPISVFRKIFIPLITPTLIASSILIFVLSAEQFMVPYMLGNPARIEYLTTIIYSRMFFVHPPRYGTSIAAAVILLLMTVFGISLYFRSIRREKRFATIIGKGFALRPIPLGKWRYLTATVLILPLLLTVGLPLSIILLQSFQAYWGPSFVNWTLRHYQELFTVGRIWLALKNSAILSTTGALVAMGIATLAGFIIYKTKAFGRKALDIFLTIPIAIPGIIFSFGLLLTWVAYLRTALAGTFLIMIMAVVGRNVPYAMRAVSAGMIQISSEMEESSTICGARSLRTLAKVTLPLLGANLLGALILLYMAIVRDIGSVLFVYSGETIVLPIMIFNVWDMGSLNSASAMVVILTLLMLAGLFVLTKIVKIDIGTALGSR